MGSMLSTKYSVSVCHHVATGSDPWIRRRPRGEVLRVLYRMEYAVGTYGGPRPLVHHHTVYHTYACCCGLRRTVYHRSPGVMVSTSLHPMARISDTPSWRPPPSISSPAHHMQYADGLWYAGGLHRSAYAYDGVHTDATHPCCLPSIYG